MREFDIDKCYSVLNDDMFNQKYIGKDLYKKLLYIHNCVDDISKYGLSKTYYKPKSKSWENSLYVASMLDEFDAIINNHLNYEIHEVIFIFRFITHNGYQKIFETSLIKTYRDYIHQTRSYKPETCTELVI